MFSNAKKYCAPLFFLVLFSGQSCSIKEDREVCPCYLTVVRPDSGAGAQGKLYWYLAAGDYGLEGMLEGEEQACDIEVPRTVLRLIAVTGISGGLSEKSGFRIGEKESYPPVYYYKTDLDTRRNSLRDTIRLHKNYCNISIGGDISDNLTYMLAGSSCGFDWDGNILEGHFSSQFSLQGTAFCCRVPRQADSSLRLDIFRSEELLRSFPIGDIIAESGYDWTAEDLDDIEIRLDYQATGVDFTVNGWMHTLTFYYEF